MESFNDFQDKLVIVYGMDGHQINSRTLTLTLTLFTDVIAILNAHLNPENAVEIVIESFETGSFKTTIREIFNKDNFKNLAIGILGSLIFEAAKPNSKPTIITTEKEVVITVDGKTIVIPRELESEYRESRKDSSVKGRINEAFGVLYNDKSIKYIEFLPDNTYVKNSILIPRENFPLITQSREELSDTFYHNEIEIEVININKDRAKITGEFYWNGQKIFAVISDTKLSYKPFTYLSKGDIISVRMIEIKRNDLYTNELMHSNFEITNIYSKR